MALKAVSIFLFLKAIETVSQLWWNFITTNKNLSSDASVCFLFLLKYEGQTRIRKSSLMIWEIFFAKF